MVESLGERRRRGRRRVDHHGDQGILALHYGYESIKRVAFCRLIESVHSPLVLYSHGVVHLPPGALMFPRLLRWYHGRLRLLLRHQSLPPAVTEDIVESESKRDQYEN